MDEGLTAVQVLADTRQAALSVRRAETDLLVAGLRWALLHPSADGTQSAPDAAAFTEDGGYEPIAGPGCPGVSEFAVAEFATVLGLGSGAAKELLGDALQLSHHLPRLWQRVLDLDVEVGAARAIAAATTRAHPGLTGEAAGWVDQKVAGLVGRLTAEQVGDVLEEAFAQFGLAVEEDVVTPQRRRVQIVALEEGYAGLARLEAVLDLGDALDLDQALAVGAHDLAVLAPSASEHERRASTLGHLARSQTSLELGGSSARRLDLVLHFSVDGTGEAAGISATGRLGERGRVLLEQVRGWAAASHTEVHVHPVVADAAPDAAAGGGVCGFPWCAAVPVTETGEKGSSTMLCREHARVADAGWSVEDLGAGAAVWSSPSGAHYRRDAAGTVCLS